MPAMSFLAYMTQRETLRVLRKSRDPNKSIDDSGQQGSPKCNNHVLSGSRYVLLAGAKMPAVERKSAVC